MTREAWARAFLRQIAAPVSHRNLLVLLSWMQAEGGTARWNPLNSTHAAPGATTYNSAGVKNYPTFAIGLEATVETLNYGADRHRYGYRKIRHRLRRNRGAEGTLRAIERSRWGTGGLGLKVLPQVRDDFDRYATPEISGS